MQKELHAFIIDVQTRDAKATFRRLEKLKSTDYIRDNGMYCHCNEASQIYIETTMTEEELDHWLLATKGVNYIGVVSVQFEAKWEEA